jgi:hypothetical protein
MYKQRIGTFCIVVGAALIGYFILTDLADQPQFGFFFMGVLGVLIGIALWWNTPSLPSEKKAERFRLLKNRKDKKK